MKFFKITKSRLTLIDVDYVNLCSPYSCKQRRERVCVYMREDTVSYEM